jgi:citrate lyase gamma subunit
MKNIFALICLSLLLTCSSFVNLQAQTIESSTKKVRLALSPVKTVGVGEEMDAQQFGAAIQNSLAEYLKSPNVELVTLEAKLPSAIEAEIKEKNIDYLISATVSHKKGGGSFGKMFGSVAPILGQVAPVAGIGGGVAGAVTGQVAASAIITAATLSQNVKAKDSIELNVTMLKASDKSNLLTKQLKGKAKSDGEDIITPIIEQTAQAIIDIATGKTATAPIEKK